jgi:prepilin-type N-terminal cleavage/methylation domain-containing protein
MIRSIPIIHKLNRAFTLVELLVSISVMTIILGISISGAPQAVTKLALADNAYQIELLIREVQLQGSSINSFDGQYGGAGIFFDLATSSQVLKFKDRVVPSITRAIGIGNGLYDSGPIDEKDGFLIMAGSNRFSKLCVATSTSALRCNGFNVPPIETLTISFNRPKQAAHIYVNGATSTNYTLACLQFDSYRSPENGHVRSIYVYRSGMIIKKFGTCS